MAERASPPGYLGYIAGALLIVLGFSFGLTYIFGAVRRITDIPEPLVMPGQEVVHLEEAGNYKVYLEPDVAREGRFSHSGNIPGFDISIENRDTGDSVVMARARHSEEYNIGGRSGFLIFNFRIEEPGDYVVSASYPTDQKGPSFGLMVGKLGIFRSILEGFGGMGLIFAGTALGVVVIVLTWGKRARLPGETEKAAASEPSE